MSNSDDIFNPHWKDFEIKPLCNESDKEFALDEPVPDQPVYNQTLKCSSCRSKDQEILCLNDENAQLKWKLKYYFDEDIR